MEQSIAAFGRLIDQAAALPRPSSTGGAGESSATVQRCQRELASLSTTWATVDKRDLSDKWARLRSSLTDLSDKLRAQGGDEPRNLVATIAAWVRRVEEEVAKLVGNGVVKRKVPVSSNGDTTGSSSAAPTKGSTRTVPEVNTEIDAALQAAQTSQSSAISHLFAQHFRSQKRLEEAFWLHLLATTPGALSDRSGQPGRDDSGQPRLRANSRPPTPQNDTQASFQERLQENVKRAFFDDAIEKLTQTLDPPMAAERLTALHADVWEVARPLLPRQRDANAPATSGASHLRQPSQAVQDQIAKLRAFFTTKLNSTDFVASAGALEELLRLLRTRCAPSRDQQVDGLIASAVDVEARMQELADRQVALGSASSPPLPPNDELSDMRKAIIRSHVDVIRRTLDLCEAMRVELAEFWAQRASEAQLKRAAKRKAVEKEREVVLEMYGGRERVRSAFWDWVGCEADDVRRSVAELKSRYRRRLAETVFGDQAVAIPPPLTQQSLAVAAGEAHAESDGESSGFVDKSPNQLPPPLLLSAPQLFRLQNRFQGLIILACLISVVGVDGDGPQATTASGDQQSEAQDWTQRVWTLLESEMEEDVSARGHQHGGGTKLAHLADEVLAAVHRRRRRRREERLDMAVGTSAIGQSQLADAEGRVTQDEAEDDRLRKTIERILQYEDPVYALLKRRLMEGVVAALAHSDTDSVSTSVSPHGHGKTAVPAMRTGRSFHSPPSKLETGEDAEAQTPTVHVPAIKGFDRLPLLRREVEMAAGELLKVGRWVENVWDRELGLTAAPLTTSTEGEERVDGPGR